METTPPLHGNNNHRGLILYEKDLEGFLSPIYRTALEAGIEIRLVQITEPGLDDLIATIESYDPGFVILGFESFSSRYFPHGVDFIDELKEQYENWPYTIVVYNIKQEDECRQLSAEDFLPIPYPQSLLDAIFRRLKSERIRLLLIENDMVQRSFLTSKLQEADFEVTACVGAEEAIKKVQLEFPDIIVSDVQLDDMNGMELCSTLKHNPYSASIPVILISASADMNTILEGLRQGASDYITKPFEFFELEQKVHFYLEKSFRRRKLILVIDDSRISRELIRSPLKKEGYRVISAQNGQIGLKLALERSPDLILTDYSMPEMDGWSLCRNLKADARTRKIPIIMVTGKDSELDRKVGRTLKIHDYITKPFVPQNLVNTVNMALLEAMVEEERTQRESFEHEMKVGHQIQEELMPDAFKDLPEGLNLHGGWIPAKHMGGDFYDYLLFEQNPDLVGIVVADVSGKGLPAALIAVNCQSFLKAISLYETTPSNILNKLNNRLCNTIAEDSFVTLFCAVINRKSMTLSYAGAGHKGMILFRPGSSEIIDLSPPGMPCGILEDFEYKTLKEKLKPGDRLILFSDGIVEARCKDEHYGEERLHQIILGSEKTLSAKELHNLILKDVNSFTRGFMQSDDITLLICAVND